MIKVPFIEGSLENVIELLKKEQPLMFDTETDGLYGRIELAQFYQRGWSDVILVRRPDPFMLASLLINTHHVMHNASYDVSTLQDNLGIKYVPKKVEDTMYLARLKYFKQQSFTLDDVMTYVLGYDPYEKAGLDKKKMQKTNWGAPVLSEDQKLYAAIDVFFLDDVYEDCIEHTQDFSYKLDMLFLGYCFDFQTNGMPVDREIVREMYQENLKKIEEYNLPINVNSYQQVRPYIGSNESDALGLAKLSIKGNVRAKEVNEVRQLIKLNSFLTKFDVDEGRIFGKFAPSARSGRATCKDQNLQQLPRKTKKCFGVDPESGRCIIYSDYPGLELRSATAIIKETAMEKLMREDEDLHSYVASMLFGKDFTKDQRQIAKTCNFNLLYGGGWKMLQSILIKEAGIYVPEIEVKSIIRRWKNLWGVIRAWQEKGQSAWRHGYHWQTPLGRRYVGKLMTDQLNIQISGFGAEVAKLATHYMYPKLKEFESALLCDFVHDSYILEVDVDDAEPIAKIVGDAMKEAWVEASKALPIKDLPMPVQVLAGYNWGKIEEGDYFYEYTC